MVRTRTGMRIRKKARRREGENERGRCEEPLEKSLLPLTVSRLLPHSVLLPLRWLIGVHSTGHQPAALLASLQGVGSVQRVWPALECGLCLIAGFITLKPV
jgi:hypothetical protein